MQFTAATKGPPKWRPFNPKLQPDDTIERGETLASNRLKAGRSDLGVGMNSVKGQHGRHGHQLRHSPQTIPSRAGRVCYCGCSAHRRRAFFRSEAFDQQPDTGCRVDQSKRRQQGVNDVIAEQLTQDRRHLAGGSDHTC